MTTTTTTTTTTMTMTLLTPARLFCDWFSAAARLQPLRSLVLQVCLWVLNVRSRRVSMRLLHFPRAVRIHVVIMLERIGLHQQVLILLVEAVDLALSLRPRAGRSPKHRVLAQEALELPILHLQRIERVLQIVQPPHLPRVPLRLRVILSPPKAETNQCSCFRSRRDREGRPKSHEAVATFCSASPGSG
eukprot:scaffold1516_cov230-Pinguiococcus_pyrenoidosus.AAC.15